MYRVKNISLYIPILVFSCIYSGSSFAAWNDLLKIFSSENESSLSESEMISGLKEALVKGTKSAVNNLGRLDGYFGNPKVKIPMPESLENVELALRKLKQDEIADEFILTMNRAAETAVPEATEIFTHAIQQMTINDAKDILQGQDNAATRYFKRTSSKDLSDKMLPVIKNATSATGVTARYKEMIDSLGFASDFVNTESLDIDRYITDKAVDGLFKMMAKEEKRIRRDPAARTTELLRKVFGT